MNNLGNLQKQFMTMITANQYCQQNHAI